MYFLDHPPPHFEAVYGEHEANVSIETGEVIEGCVSFDDGSVGEHDFAFLTREPGPMLEPLREETYFARVFLEFGAPTWPNGFDIAPEWLRREMEQDGELSRQAAK
jgi:hypothetical protein